VTAKKIGLTGGLGSGKSTVANIFKSFGIETLDADQIARQLTQPGSIEFDQILSYFGNNIIDDQGRINRKLLGNIVFKDAEKLDHLESILHPPIKKAMDAQAHQCKQKYCILEIPLLIETGQYQDMDRVILVTCKRKNRIKRLRQSRGLDEKTISRILYRQMSDEDKMQYADDVIENNGTIIDLEDQVKVLHLNFINWFEC